MGQSECRIVRIVLGETASDLEEIESASCSVFVSVRLQKPQNQQHTQHRYQVNLYYSIITATTRTLDHGRDDEHRLRPEQLLERY